jgi:hypothetical protein
VCSHVVWHQDCKMNGVLSTCTVLNLHNSTQRPWGWRRLKQFWPPQQVPQGARVHGMGAGLQVPVTEGTGCTLHEGAMWSRLAVCHPVLSSQTVVQPRGNNCCAVSNLQYPSAQQDAVGKSPGTPHKHTPNAVDKDNGNRGAGVGERRGGCFPSQRALEVRTLCSQVFPQHKSP